MRSAILALSVVVAIAGAGASARHVQTASVRKDWPSYYGSAGNDHYSDLKQITVSNVAKLQEAWRFDTKESGGLETTPLIVGNTLYALTPSQHVIALDGRTGRLLWTFDSGVIATGPNRGLSYWQSGQERRLFAGIMNRLYALDPETGNPIDTFGNKGYVDLREGLGREASTQSIALTSPGVVYKDLIIVGGRVPETLPAPPGDIRAFDVRTGEQHWSFHTIPHPGEPGSESWPADAWKVGGSANNWAGMAIDQEHGIVYVPTGSAAPDFYGGDRRGDNLYANSIIALNAETGQCIWHFQGVHHDLWDRDFSSPPTLLTIHRNGKDIPTIAESSKQGLLFVFNRLTGDPLFPIEERPVPKSTIPEEYTSPTQPIPLEPAPFARQEITETTLTNRTPAAHAWAVEQFQKMRHVFPYDPFRLNQGTLVMPSFEGGGEWGGMATDPHSGVLFINANDYASIGGLAEHRGSSSGQSIYLNQCGECHGVNRAGSPPAFPSLEGVDKRLNESQITTLVHQGKGRMPSFPNIQGDSLKRLLDYLLTGIDKQDEDSGEIDLVRESVADQKNSTLMNSPGAKIYAKNCAICHGESREGVGSAFPSLIGVTKRLSDEQILDPVHHGKGRMLAFPQIQGEEQAELMRFLHGGGLQPQKDDKMEYTMTGYRRFLDPDGYPAVAPPWGTLSAIDLNTGRYLWKRPLGEYPALAAQGVKDTGTENYGGPLVTAGGIVFIAATNFDHKFRAFDERNGGLLWETTLPFAGNATPATYEIDGKQYVVIAAGGSSLMVAKGALGGVYIAYALPN